MEPRSDFLFLTEAEKQKALAEERRRNSQGYVNKKLDATKPRNIPLPLPAKPKKEVELVTYQQDIP
jgi:hypothetical protein